MQKKFNELNLLELQTLCYNRSVASGWWDGLDLEAITPTKLVLIHSEISESMEGFRKGIKDDHLPDRDMMEVELADAVIRIFDLAGAHGYNLMAAMEEKMEYNANRADHKPEARAAAGGKKF